jgi:hypothetical protein
VKPLETKTRLVGLGSRRGDEMIAKGYVFLSEMMKMF